MRPRLGAVILAGICAAGLSQDIEPTKRTEITVNETILVPGKELPPGKYVLKLMNSSSNRHIVQIYNEDQTQLQTTILAIPNERVQRTGDTVLTYWETPAGSPRALRAWFYPGDTYGQEFAYPKEMADRIAQSNNNAQIPTFEGNPSADQLSGVTLIERTERQPSGAAVTTEAPRNTAAIQADAVPTPQSQQQSSTSQSTTTTAAQPGTAISQSSPRSQPTGAAGAQSTATTDQSNTRQSQAVTTTDQATATARQSEATERQAERAAETIESTTPRVPPPAAGAPPAAAAQGARAEIETEARSPIGTADRTADQGRETVIAQNNPPAGNQPQPAAAPEGQLPATASPAPLLLLIALVSLGGALFLRQRRA